MNSQNYIELKQYRSPRYFQIFNWWGPNRSENNIEPFGDTRSIWAFVKNGQLQN